MHVVYNHILRPEGFSAFLGIRRARQKTEWGTEKKYIKKVQGELKRDEMKQNEDIWRPCTVSLSLNRECNVPHL